MMDQEHVRIVAAAPGVIVDKIDGNFDRDCAIAGNGGFNAVFVQQDDGLTAWYLHMKNGTPTTKAIGERVAAGEFLGFVGSSGPSSLPHLHFELHDGANHVVDPFNGACNAAPERWIVAQPYESPRIDTLTTHSAEPALVDCGVDNGVPVHEDPHFAGSVRSRRDVLGVRLVQRSSQWRSHAFQRDRSRRQRADLVGFRSRERKPAGAVLFGHSLGLERDVACRRTGRHLDVAGGIRGAHLPARVRRRCGRTRATRP